jgi:uncharacterized protein GlcG (DUF336 family)
VIKSNKLLLILYAFSLIVFYGQAVMAKNTGDYLTSANVDTIIAQAFQEASKGNNKAVTVAVVDRVGNVLGVFQSTAAATPNAPIGILTTIESGRFTYSPPPLQPLTGNTGTLAVFGVNPDIQKSGIGGAAGAGLEGAQVPATVAAISKAITAAYLSSSKNNALSSYTAAQIIQEHFNPGVINMPSGPLFGVQFSQLPCGDLVQQGDVVQGIGPRRSPLGFSGMRGGLPLYRNGNLVGGVGVVSTAYYSIALNIYKPAPSSDERIAIAASYGFLAPQTIRANRITVNGLTLRYTSINDNQILSNPYLATYPTSSQGSIVSVPEYFTGPTRDGVAFGSNESGITAVPKGSPFYGLSPKAYVLSDFKNNISNRYPPIDGNLNGSGNNIQQLTSQNVTDILRQSISVGNKSRSQIRLPLGAATAHVSEAVVDTNGTILGILMPEDPAVFSIDVALQKARTTAFFVSKEAAADLNTTFSSYVKKTQSLIPFATKGAIFADGSALTPRALGNLARPLFPDGIQNKGAGPLSLPYQTNGIFKVGINQWSPFNDGLQLDLVFTDFLYSITNPFNVLIGAPVQPIQDCATSLSPEATNPQGTQGTIPKGSLANGIQIFPGSVPIYKNGVFVGALGGSGDGVDQDDMTTFLGVYQARGVSNANLAIRSNKIVIPNRNLALRFIQCPFRPFINDDTEKACGGK